MAINEGDMLFIDRPKPSPFLHGVAFEMNCII